MAKNLNEDFTFLTVDEIASSLAKRIQKVRKKKFKTQKIFAEHLGITFSKVSRFEKSGAIQFSDLIRILKALGLVSELEDLFETSKGEIKW